MINLAQHRSALRRGVGLVTLLMVLLVVGGCNSQQPAAIPTPDLEILAPTATGVTARVEVVVVVVTATSAPTADEPTAEPTAPSEPTADATEASSNESAASPNPASGTASTTIEAPTVSLTWTPARQVTPLLPTTELTITTSDDGSITAVGTPTPPTTVTVTVSATAATNNATPSATENTATPAESPTAAESAGTGGESASGLSDEELIGMGETVYATECASCHQINGEGNSTYPALNGSELLTADDPTAAISLVLNGQGEMPAFNEILSTEEIAAVLSHERTAWDNNASVVTVAQVEEVRGN